MDLTEDEEADALAHEFFADTRADTWFAKAMGMSGGRGTGLQLRRRFTAVCLRLPDCSCCRGFIYGCKSEVCRSMGVCGCRWVHNTCGEGARRVALLSLTFSALKMKTSRRMRTRQRSSWRKTLSTPVGLQWQVAAEVSMGAGRRRSQGGYLLGLVPHMRQLLPLLERGTLGRVLAAAHRQLGTL